MMRAALYIRVSTEEQAEQDSSGLRENILEFLIKRQKKGIINGIV